ncbi:unnamed protein product, partial [Meganyctiphanes norvegica]
MARLVCALVLVGLVPLVYGRSSGAPTDACTTMTPQHGDTVVQAGPSPYGIAAPNTAAPGQQITIRVHGGGAVFKGFLVRALEGANPSTGQFVVAPNAFQCDNPSDSATHANPNPKNMVDLTWQAPPYATSVTFQSTVVFNFTTIHRNAPVTIQVL